MDVRTILTEALSRANIVPRRQAAPDDKVQTAYMLLKAIVSKFNNDGYLAFTEAGLDLPPKKLIHIHDKVDSFAGDYNYYLQTEADLAIDLPDAEDVENDARAVVTGKPQWYKAANNGSDYSWVPVAIDEFDPRYQLMQRYSAAYHVKVPEVSKLNTLSINRQQPLGMIGLSFQPQGRFDNLSNADLVWTFAELAQGEYVIEVKPMVASNAARLKLHYNRAIEFDINTDLRIPDAYIELLICALTYKLAVKYPRLDDAHVQRLKNDVDDMLSNVRTPKADHQLIYRDGQSPIGNDTYWGVVSGGMWR